MSGFLAAPYGFLCAERLTMTTYQPRTNGQAYRYNKTIVTRLRHYVARHQHD